MASAGAVEVLDVRISSTGALEELAAVALSYMAEAKAANTCRAYRSDWNHFAAWCDQHGFSSLPASPETVTLYLAALGGTHRSSTLQRKLTSISKAHQLAGYESPATLRHGSVSETLKGIRRRHGTSQHGKTPLLTRDILRILAAAPETLVGKRDRTLVLMGFIGGFRRSELTSLNVEDLRWTEEGLVVRLRRSKTDQEGQGTEVALPWTANAQACAARACRDWLESAGITEGPVFRRMGKNGTCLPHRLNSNSVAKIIKRAVAAAGLDPAAYAGHSLRAGFATQAYLNGVPELAIMRQTGHKSLDTVRKYIRERTLFRDHPATRLGL
jgi:integrase